MSDKYKGKITIILQAISIIPLLLFGIILMLLASHQFTKAMYGQVEEELRNVAHNLETMFELIYPGDYKLVGDDDYRLYKDRKSVV